MIWAVGYGIGAALLALIAWRSKDRTTRIMSAILGMEWLGYNAAIGFVEPYRWWVANPATIATVALAVTLMTALLRPNRFTKALFGLYGASMLLAVATAFAGATLETWYFWATNAIFASRLFTVGGWGVYCALRRKRSVGPDRIVVVPAPRPTLARHRPF